MGVFRDLPEWDFPLYQGDDRARLAEIEAAVRSAERVSESDSARWGDDDAGAVSAAKKAWNDFIDELAERTPNVRCKAIGSKRFHDLLLKHPPRMVDKTDAEGKVAQVVHDDDQGWGVNTDTFPRALLTFREGDVRTIIAPEFASDAECEQFVDDELTDGELMMLWMRAHEENRGGSASPKSLPRYSETPASNET